jgi:hypothetical protein
MRYATVLVLVGTLVLAACSTTSSARRDAQAPSPAIVQFLLTSAATDFHTQRSPDPARFRNVQLGHVKTPGGDDQYLLCGQFLPARKAGNAEWTPFVTIATSDYEQYIGGLAEASFCRNPSVIWDEESDLSSALQSRLDALGDQTGSSK